MALETLKDCEAIDSFNVARIKKSDMTEWPNEYTKSTKTFINIDDENNILSFQLQNGPVKENGVNGCQVDTIAKALSNIVLELNGQFPCKENETFLYHIHNAFKALKARKKNREHRGVEGESKK